MHANLTADMSDQLHERRSQPHKAEVTVVFDGLRVRTEILSVWDHRCLLKEITVTMRY